MNQRITLNSEKKALRGGTVHQNVGQFCGGHWIESQEVRMESPSAAAISSKHSVARGTPLGGRLLWSLEGCPPGNPRGCKETPPFIHRLI
ncbi:hypothetical protein NPIL_675611, partial [Nephila pilipes]